MEKSPDAANKSDAGNTVALLTPVVKSFLTDLGLECTLEAQQVFGGHGYIAEHGMEQLVRDCRITQIYEGTNEVQAGDLVMRKLSGGTGEFADRLFANWQAGVEGAAADALQRLVDATAWIRDKLASDDAPARAAATDYQRLFALTAIACLWSAIEESIRDKSGAYYDVKRKTARIYMQQVLPETISIYEKIVNGGDALHAFSIEDF